jgi:PTS system nitrogen regulatory IIA component
MQLTIKQAAQFLEVAEEQLHDWIDQRAIPFSRERDRVRFNEAELLEWSTARGLKASHVLRGAGAAVGPSLERALLLGGIHREVAGTDLAAALRSAVGRLPLSPGTDPEEIVEILLAREAVGSTAVGDGIAIPHARAPIVQNGVDPAVALCSLAQAVDFGAADGRPVHTLFLLATPTVDTHLTLLARLAAALHDPPFRAAVLALAPAAEILAHARRLDDAAAARPSR